MNIRIAGQSSKSNYQNTGSCGSAVIYNEHELRDLPQLFQELGVKPEDLAWFDMDGHAVSGAEVMDKIGRLTAHLGKNDAKFYCTMICPSDDEALVMGATVDMQITNGRPFVFDVIDAYAENFNREGVKDRHDLVAFAIPHVYKSEGKQQIHWHVIQARLSRGFKVEIGDGKYRTKHYKLSPLTNHRNTSKGAVKGGFDRVAFDGECEKRFDIRYNYERRVEQSFDYLLAEKKGTVEEKAVQETRLALQNLPELEKSIQTAITRRVERLDREATERANKERQAQEEAARQKAEAEAKAAAEKAAEEARIAAEKLAGESETFVIHGDSDATLYSNRPSSRSNNMEKLHEAARSILKYYTWGANVRCNHPKEFVEDAVIGQQFGTVTFDISKARFVGEDRSEGMLENPDEVIQFADHTGRTLDLFTPKFWDYWRLMLTNLKNWLARLPKKAPSIESIEKVPAPVPPQEPQKPQKQWEATLPTSEPKPAAMPVQESAPVHRPATAPAAQDTQPVAPVAQQQTAPTLPPAAKPTYKVVQKFTCNSSKYQIRQYQGGTMRLVRYETDKRSPVINGKHTEKAWYVKEIFTSYKEIGRDGEGVYFKIKDTDGKTRYINQYGIDLDVKKKQKFVLGGTDGVKRR